MSLRAFLRVRLVLVPCCDPLPLCHAKHYLCQAMLIQTGPLVTTLVGSAAGLTVQRSRFGLIGRSRPQPRRFQGVSALNSKARMGMAVRLWRTLTPTQRENWQTYADKFTWVNRLGEVYTGTGYLAFCSVNFPAYFSRVAAATPTIQFDPPAYADPVMPTDLAAIYDGPTGTISLTSSDLKTDSATTLRVFVSPYVSAGRSSYSGGYSFSQDIAGGTNFPVDISGNIGKLRGNLVDFPATQSLFISVQATNDGRPKRPRIIVQIVGTGG